MVYGVKSVGIAKRAAITAISCTIVFVKLQDEHIVLYTHRKKRITLADIE